MTDLQASSNQYPGEDKFLHFFELNSKAQSFIGLSLQTGVRLISGISILLSFISVLGSFNVFSILVEGSGISAYSCLIYATYNDNYKWGFIGYFILVIFFYIGVIIGSIIALFMLGKKQNK